MNICGSLSQDPEDCGLRPFIGDPKYLSQAEREALLFQYAYDRETVEFLAIEYRLTPSLLSSWIEREGIEVKDLNEESSLAEYEKALEQEKRIKAAQLAGSVLAHANLAWKKVSKTEQYILSAIEKAAQNLNEADFINPADLSILAKAHTAMVRQLLDTKAFTEREEGLGKLAGSVSRQLETLFDEINDLVVLQ